MKDKPLFDIRNGVLKKCNSMACVTIPDGVTGIGKRAFYGCKTIDSIIIPEGVTSISDEAFMSCKNLKSVTIPSSVKTIGRCAFNNPIRHSTI